MRLVALLVVSAVLTTGCHKTYTKITTEYENKVTDGEIRKVSSEITVYGTVREAVSTLKEMLKFANDEVMYQRRK